MIREFRCDLHIHTCLSPCADLDMSPGALVRKAIDIGLDIIAVCDHNASENARYAIRAAEGSALTVLPGMEVTSSEEVHVLALFDRLEALRELQETVYRHLEGKNDEDVFGCQAIVNEMDEVEGFNERLLIGATGLPLERVVARIHELGGLAVASHIDREGFSLIHQLGFVPEDLDLDALEITGRTGMAQARARFPELARFAFIVSSDAHRLEDIGRGLTRMQLETASLPELKMAFERRNGRFVRE